MLTIQDVFFSINPNFIYFPSVPDFCIYAKQKTNLEKKIQLIHRHNEKITEEFLNTNKSYNVFYIEEKNRSSFYKYIADNPHLGDVRKLDSFKHLFYESLKNIFTAPDSHKSLKLTVFHNNCTAFVANIIELYKDKSLDDLFQHVQQLSHFDHYTFDHSINVSLYSILMAPYFFEDITYKQKLTIGIGGLLHDIGKLKIPVEILNKQEKLTTAEYNLVKSHPDWGKELLTASPNNSESLDFESVVRVVLEHHENYVGDGYPSGLSHDQIHPYSEIVSLADCLDALTTPRSYQEPLDLERALRVMSKSAGIKWNEEKFSKFCKAWKGDLLPSNKCLKPDFDPCIPHLDLKSELVAASKIKTNKNLF